MALKGEWRYLGKVSFGGGQEVGEKVQQLQRGGAEIHAPGTVRVFSQTRSSPIPQSPGLLAALKRGSKQGSFRQAILILQQDDSFCLWSSKYQIVISTMCVHSIKFNPHDSPEQGSIPILQMK